MPYIAPTQYQDRRALMANTDAQEQQTESSQLRNMLLGQENQRANALRQIYSQGRQPTVEQIGAVDPNAAMEYQNNQSLQAQRESENMMRKQSALKGIMTRFREVALQRGYDPSRPETQHILEDLRPAFTPYIESVTGQKASDDPVSWDNVVALSDMTPGELSQQKTQAEISKIQQVMPYELEHERQKQQIGNEYDIAKQQTIIPMQISREKEIEDYKSRLKTQQQIHETEGKAQGQAKLNLPKVIDQTRQAYDLLEGIKNHPGLSSVVGVPDMTGGLLAGKIVPGTDSANFNAKLKQAQGQAFMQAFESLKGGGQITEVEGQKATQAIANLDSAQTEEEFKKAITELQDILITGLNRAESAAKGEFKPGSKEQSDIPEGWTDEDEAEYQRIVGGK